MAERTPINVNVPGRMDTSHVVKLARDNYEQWDLQISLILKSAKVWGYVSGDILKPLGVGTSDREVAWMDKDYYAQAIIVPTLDAVNTNHIYKCETAKEIYDKLKAIHSDSSSLNKQNTLTKFFNYQHRKGASLIETYTEVERLARHLNIMGVSIDSQTTVTKIVSSLPDTPHLSFKKSLGFSSGE